MINERAYNKFKTGLNNVRTLSDLKAHAMVGKICTCGDCFCCGAQTALDKFEKQADLLAEKFGKFETISNESADKLIDIMNKAPYLALEVIAARKVKFAGRLAMNRITQIKNQAK